MAKHASVLCTYACTVCARTHACEATSHSLVCWLLCSWVLRMCVGVCKYLCSLECTLYVCTYAYRVCVRCVCMFTYQRLNRLLSLNILFRWILVCVRVWSTVCMYVYLKCRSRPSVCMYMYVHAYIYPSRFASTVRTVCTYCIFNKYRAVYMYLFLFAGSFWTGFLAWRSSSSVRSYACMVTYMHLRMYVRRCSM